MPWVVVDEIDKYSGRDRALIELGRHIAGCPLCMNGKPCADAAKLSAAVPTEGPGKFVVAEIEQTCAHCPSAWQGKLKTGHVFYIRYRWGYLSFNIYEGGEGQRSTEVWGEQVGDSLDGVMDLDTVKAHLCEVLEFPE